MKKNFPYFFHIILGIIWILIGIFLQSGIELIIWVVFGIIMIIIGFLRKKKNV